MKRLLLVLAWLATATPAFAQLGTLPLGATQIICVNGRDPEAGALAPLDAVPEAQIYAAGSEEALEYTPTFALYDEAATEDPDHLGGDTQYCADFTFSGGNGFAAGTGYSIAIYAETGSSTYNDIERLHVYLTPTVQDAVTAALTAWNAVATTDLPANFEDFALDGSGRVQVQSGTGAGQISLTSGLVSVGSLAENSITATALHSNAVDAIQNGLATPGDISSLNDLSAADVWTYSTGGGRSLTADVSVGGIATNAITADAVHANAATEIGDAAWASTTRQLTGTQTFDLTGSISGSVGSVTGNVGGLAGTIQSLDTLNTGIQNAIAALPLVQSPRNTAYANYQFPLFEAATGQLASGLTVTCTFITDGSAAPCNDTPSEIGSTGVYTVDFTAGEFDGESGTVILSAPGAHLVVQTFRMQQPVAP